MLRKTFAKNWGNESYPRTDYILRNRFKRYLLSTTLTAAAGSLNWFVDSFVVSFLLGSEAMSIVNICNPITFVVSTLYSLLGVGGSTMYAESLGKMDKKLAGSYYRCALTAMSAACALLTAFGLIFCNQIANVLCGENEIYLEAIPYIRISFINVFPVAFVGVLSSFIIVSGNPNIATAVNIISNVVNIFMDVVYIHFFGMKVEGAALATLTGNLTALLVIGYFLLIRKNIDLEFSGSRTHIGTALSDIFRKGLASAFNQLGFSIKILVCNSLAMELGGLIAVTVYSVCMQTVTIVTVVLSGMLDAMVPILAFIKGQKDYSGIRLLVKKIYLYQFAASAVMAFLFFVFSENVMQIYNVPSEGLALGSFALKIFAFSHLFRPVTVIFMYYAQLIDRKRYAFVISLIDGVVGVPAAAFALTHCIGLTGLWISFPLTAALLFIGVIFVNAALSKKSDGAYETALLLPAEEKNAAVFEVTVPENAEAVSYIIEELQQFCLKNGCSSGISIKVAVACEEMCQYILENQHNRNFYMDIFIKLYPDTVELNIRNLGKPFQNMDEGIQEKYSNVYVLHKMASDVCYDYVMGMNETRIMLRR